MAASQKKVVIRRFDAPPAWGYLPQEDLLQPASGQLPAAQLMAVDGRLQPIPLHEIKLIAYVRDFNLDDPIHPERLDRRLFQGRPRGDGLWVRLTFRDGDLLEGLVAMGLPFLDTAILDHGLLLTPPDLRGNTQRVYAPRTALQDLEVLGWVTAPSRKLKNPTIGDTSQSTLFEA